MHFPGSHGVWLAVSVTILTAGGLAAQTPQVILPGDSADVMASPFLLPASGLTLDGLGEPDHGIPTNEALPRPSDGLTLRIYDDGARPPATGDHASPPADPPSN